MNRIEIRMELAITARGMQIFTLDKPDDRIEATLCQFRHGAIKPRRDTANR
ncbi:MAG: hypothetical protein Fues2KO_26260 [Fuerstiella sp.]